MMIDIPHSKAKRILHSLILRSFEACNPLHLIEKQIKVQGTQLLIHKMKYDLSQYTRVLCVGAGKASGHMAVALEQLLGDRLEGGLIIVKDGYRALTKKVCIIEASHPIPDQRGVRATKQILKLIQSLTDKDLLIFLLSGGASSLLCAPTADLTLSDKKKTTKLLLQCGASIHELNTVRKHLSAVKGGRLAKATVAKQLTFIISDVLGDDLTTIGSGPTVNDPTTFLEAQKVLIHYKILTRVPPAIRHHLAQGIRGLIDQPPKTRPKSSTEVHHMILANNRTATEAVAEETRRVGIHPFIFKTPLIGEAREVGKILGSLAKDLSEFGNPVPIPACLIAGGEPTVTLSGKGKGGRAQECVLAAAQEISGLREVFVAGFGTDGTDGPTEVAGAVADGQTIKRAKRIGMSPGEMLAANNSYEFFKKVGGHIITGPTMTNVNDIYLVLAL